MKRTLDSMISRYRNYWVNLHPIELFKFFPYLKERKFSYIIRIRRDIFDEMNYIDDICEKFYKC